MNAGTQLAQIESLQGLVSANVLLSLALLGVFPIFAKKINRRWQQSRLMKKWQKPKSFDRNLVVIGAGAGGLVTSYIGAAVKAKVTLIEKHHMGEYLNTGCVPSAILRSAKARLEINHAKDFGVNVAQVEVDFPAVMARVKAVIQKIEPHDSMERYTKLGVECVQGEAEIISPWEVSVNDQILTAKNIVIATGKTFRA